MKPSALLTAFFVSCRVAIAQADADPEALFMPPPESAKPGVLRMWMGSDISSVGITRDLEALKAAGFNGTTMFPLSDITTSLAAEIPNRPGLEIIAWTEGCRALVRHAAEELKRLGMEFGMHNCPGYESRGGPWITAGLPRQDLCWSVQQATGGENIITTLQKPDTGWRARI